MSSTEKDAALATAEKALEAAREAHYDDTPERHAESFASGCACASCLVHRALAMIRACK